MTYRLAKSLELLRSQVNAQWPYRSKASDGWIGDASHAARTSDHNPWVKDGNVGVVTAIDITHDPAHGVDGYLVSRAIHADPRVKYVIWNREIFNTSVSQSWRPYTGTNPHNKHVHVSVRPEQAYYDSIIPWSLGPVAQDDVLTPRTATKPNLKLGSTGEDVKILQNLLHIISDGNFGPKTEAAVKAFQKATGLVVDGKVGPYTWEALNVKPDLTDVYALLTSSEGIDLIKMFESCSLSAYQVGGIWHIGWGRSASSGKPPAVVSNLVISQTEADQMFLDDLADFEGAVRTAVKVPLTQGQFDALVSIAYNKGATWFRHSDLLKAVNVGNMKLASSLILSEVPTGKFYNGILRRRKAEDAMFLS